nr:MAG TPA: zinc-ribbon containing domain protein [Caudoviricetes sp.]
MAKYIDKEAAISLIKRYGHDAIDGGRYSLDTVDDCIELANRIETLPTADVAPVVHGRWVPFHSEAAGNIQYCSACGIGFDAKTAGCPHCRAKMDGGDNNAAD